METVIQNQFIDPLSKGFSGISWYKNHERKSIVILYGAPLHHLLLSRWPVAYCHSSVIILLQPTFKLVAYHCTNYKTEGFIPFRNDNLCMLRRNVYYLCLFSNSQHILAVYRILYSNLQLVFWNNVSICDWTRPTVNRTTYYYVAFLGILKRNKLPKHTGHSVRFPTTKFID